MLRLYVFRPGDDWDDDRMPPTAMRTTEYLRARPPWIPDLGETLLLVDPPVDVSLLPLNPFGLIYDLAAQLGEAAARLAIGKRALIRSSIEATPLYLALEPRGDVTLLSILAPLPRAAAFTPLPPGPYAQGADRREELHAYVEAHRDELRPGAPGVRMMGAEQLVQDVPLPSAGLPEALKQEARDAFRLYKTLFPDVAVPADLT